MPLERQWEQHNVSGLTVAPGTWNLTYDISQKFLALGWGAPYGQPANTLVMMSGTLLICVSCLPPAYIVCHHCQRGSAQ